MLLYLIAGLVLGSIYAIAASGVVITFVSTGVLNVAFGAIAYFIDRFYYYLDVQHGWGILPSALVAVVVAGPVLGLVLWAGLFRHLRHAPQVIKIVSTIGLTVAIPPIAEMLFGNPPIYSVPGLAPAPVHIFHVFGASITMDQLIVYLCVIAVMSVGAGVLRFTDAGLQVRSLVDSRAMTSLMGSNPVRIELGIWISSTFLAGLTGILIGPVVGLDDPNNFTLIVVAAFAAVVAAKLTSIPWAVLTGFLMGIGGSVIQKYLPPSSSFTAAIIPSIPGIFILIFLIYQVIRRGQVSEDSTGGGPLDRAVLPQGGALASLSQPATTTKSSRVVTGLFILVVCLLPIILHSFWAGLPGEAAAYGIAFLSFSLVTGEGGMIWLCEISFAAFGAIATGQFATVYHIPVLAAVLIGGTISGLIGAVIAMLTIRLGDLYVALATLTFGLLVENLVYVVNRWYQDGVGVAVPRPSFAQGNRGFDYLAIGAFLFIALVISTVRRSTGGLALTAMRGSPNGIRTLGVSVVTLKVVIAASAAMVAGIAGGFLSMYSNTAIPGNYPTLLGLTWMAVLVTNGVRSNAAALLGGLGFTYIPALFVTYLSSRWQLLPGALFGLGAVLVARNPDGVIAEQARQLEAIIRRLYRRSGPTTPPDSSQAPFESVRSIGPDSSEAIAGDQA